jgi:hypothetical protein
VRQRAAGQERERLRVAKWIMLRLASALLFVGSWASPVVAHHPGGISGARVILEGSQAGYSAVLEVLPADPTAGRTAEFFLYVTPDGPGDAYTGQARLWLRKDSSPAESPRILPMEEKGRGAVAIVYAAGHRFEGEGVYAVEVELERLQARWAGSLRIEQASPWFLKSGKLMALAGLVGMFVVVLEWWKRRREKMP